MTLPVSTKPHGQPTLSDLMVRFLATRSDAAFAPAVESAEGEVEPFEVAAGFRVDPRTAWADALAATRSALVPPPTDWAGLVNQPTASFAVPLAAGNFPQRVKDLHPLLTRFEPAELRPAADPLPTAGLSGLRTWIVREMKKGQPVSTLVAAGVARVLGELDWASELLADVEPACTGALRAVWENERAALDWHSGRAEQAYATWAAMAESPVVLFNRGMALLFLGRPAEARVALVRAIECLPETSGWADLAELYRAIAKISG